MKKLLLLTLIITATLFTNCSKDDPIAVQPTTNVHSNVGKWQQRLSNTYTPGTYDPDKPNNNPTLSDTIENGMILEFFADQTVVQDKEEGTNVVIFLNRNPYFLVEQEINQNSNKTTTFIAGSQSGRGSYIYYCSQDTLILSHAHVNGQEEVFIRL